MIEITDNGAGSSSTLRSSPGLHHGEITQFPRDCSPRPQGLQRPRRKFCLDDFDTMEQGDLPSRRPRLWHHSDDSGLCGTQESTCGWDRLTAKQGETDHSNREEPDRYDSEAITDTETASEKSTKKLSISSDLLDGQAKSRGTFADATVLPPASRARPVARRGHPPSISSDHPVRRKIIRSTITLPRGQLRVHRTEHVFRPS